MELHQLEETCLMDLGDLLLLDREILAPLRRLVSLNPLTDPHLGQSLHMVVLDMDLLLQALGMENNLDPIGLHNLIALHNPIALPALDMENSLDHTVLQWTVILLPMLPLANMLLHRISMHQLVTMLLHRISIHKLAIMLLHKITILLLITSMHLKISILETIMISLTRTSTTLQIKTTIIFLLTLVGSNCCMGNKNLE